MAETLSFTCPACRANLRAPSELQGKKARCKRCNHVFVLRANTPGKAGAAPPKSRPAAQPPRAGKPPAKTAPSPPPARAPGESDMGPATYGFLSEEKNEAGGANPSSEAPPGAPGQVHFEHVERDPYGVTELDLTPRCPFCAGEMGEDDIICLHCGFNTQTRSHGRTVRTYAVTPKQQFLWSLPGVLCVLAIFALIGGIIYLWTGLPDPQSDKVKAEWWSSFIDPARVWGTIICLFLIAGAGMFAVKRLVLNPKAPEPERK